MAFLLHAQNFIVDLVTLALFITAGIYILLGVYIRRQGLGGAKVMDFVWLMFAMAWWSAGYGMEVYFPALPAKIFLNHIEIPAIAFIPFFWLSFILEFIGESRLLTLRNKMLAAITPVFLILAEWTNGVHHLYFTSFQIGNSSGLNLLRVGFGPLFWVYLAYSYLMLGLGTALLMIQVARWNSLFRAQSLAILLGVLSPWIASALYVFNLFPVRNLDITPFAFIPTALVLAWAIKRYRLFQLLPPLENAVLQNLCDGILMVDSLRRVTYLNRAVEAIFSIDINRAMGQPVATVCSVCAETILPLIGEEEQSAEVTLGQNESARHFEVHISPAFFTGRQRKQRIQSYTLVFHDITDWRNAQAALNYREAILQAVSLAAESFLKSAAWEKNIPKVLERMGRAADVSRVYIFERRATGNGAPLLRQRYEWVRPGVEPQIDNPALQEFEWNSAGFAPWDVALAKRGIISGLTRDFPAPIREHLARQNVLSIAIVPVFVSDDFWGLIGFDECARERVWSEAELEALKAAADIFGAALTRGIVERRLLDRQHSLSLMQEILRSALGKSGIREMSLFLVDHLGSLIGANHCFLALWNEEREQMIPIAAYGVKEELYLNMQVLPGEKTFTASALENGSLLVVNDAQDSPYVSPRIAKLFGTRSVLVIPMIADEKKLGAVLLGFNRIHTFTPEEIILSEQATDLVTLALAKVQAAEQARHRAEESETLRRAGMTISETLDLQEATTRLLEQLAFVVPHDSASVQLLRDGELEIIGGEGWSNPAAVLGLRFPVPGDNPNTVVIETRKPYLVSDTYETFPAFHALEQSAHIRSWLGVPLIVRAKVIGLLAIDSREPHHFTQDDIELASAFAGQVAVAIENARLFDETQRLAITDGLTGLYNRRHFLELAQREFERAQRYKRSLSAMIFDVDHFKQINDTYGHPIGDEVLRAIATLCNEKLREADPIGRYGGEEFVALVVEAPSEVAFHVAERLRSEVEKMTVHSEKGDLRITISVGVAEANINTPNLGTLINRADQAMYVAKHKGRNRVVVGR